MAPQNFLTQFSDIPIYNTKAVAQETGVPADTFRAWERRYGVPRPHRTEGGHRLYSERDIAVIRWLRDRTAEGLTISQAIALMTSGNDTNLSWLATAVDTEPHSWERLNSQFLAALTDYDEKRAERIVGEAFALYPLDDVFFKLIQPTMFEIGEQWHAGKLSVTVEHFATQFVRRKLSSILNTYSISEGRGLLIVGCAPSEQHDLGALLLSVLLVRHGWQVVYLGPQVPLKDLVDTIQRLQPDMVCLSSSTIETAIELVETGRVLSKLAPPAPSFGYGGRAFALNPVLRDRVPGIYLGDTAQEGLEVIAETLNSNN
ncbi:MAG: MerR family transcriptional regulator [Chloroflexaceae bacterium]|nr:MerR family transcriptional regulator [Chloroflexaceae bacterium]NJO06509.1 MerR family transcriptional regulator [Chloroflexaceae bacterium]